mmetsp:Transcript_37622/g.94486  ORF Transcript_37622/g.94486 Transcript_37622/m.94486 type:complete len:224 (+) Transcript_37622:254-925(+)
MSSAPTSTGWATTAARVHGGWPAWRWRTQGRSRTACGSRTLCCTTAPTGGAASRGPSRPTRSAGCTLPDSCARPGRRRLGARTAAAWGPRSLAACLPRRALRPGRTTPQRRASTRTGRPAPPAGCALSCASRTPRTCGLWCGTMSGAPTCCSRPATPPGRHTTAGAASARTAARAWGTACRTTAGRRWTRSSRGGARSRCRTTGRWSRATSAPSTCRWAQSTR